MKGSIMTSGGGGTKLFAAIGVIYPEGSACTCTNGTKTLTAKTTTGQWVFAIPEAGTWTVTATQGTNSKSQSVSITSEGQFESVELSYALVLIENGELVQGYAWENPDAYAPAYKVIKPIIANVKTYKNMVYTIYIDNLATAAAYFEIGLFSGLNYSSAVVQTSKYDQSSGILGAGNAKEFVIPIASTVPNDCYIGTFAASLAGHILDLRLE